MKDIIALCNRDKEDNGIENDQSNLGNNYVCLHNRREQKAIKKLKEELKRYE